MYCINCGKEIDEKAAACPSCGVSPYLSSEKDKTAAGLLAIFLGFLGIHKFYLGYTGSGLVYLLTNTVGLMVTWIVLFLPNIVLGIISFVEGIIYLTKTDQGFQDSYVKGKQSWF